MAVKYKSTPAMEKDFGNVLGTNGLYFQASSSTRSDMGPLLLFGMTTSLKELFPILFGLATMLEGAISAFHSTNASVPNGMPLCPRLDQWDDKV